MTRPRFGAALGATCVLLAGCSPGGEPELGDAREGGSVSVALAAAPETLDPAVANDPADLQAVWLVHTPLLTYARAEGAGGTQLVPGLAAEMPERSDDGRTFTLTLRQGLRYSDGRAVAASDFERGVKRALRLHPDGLELFGNVAGARRYSRSLLTDGDIEGISADGRTGRVRIDLVEPDPSFAYALAAPMAAPAPAGTPMRDLGLRPAPGVGPYRTAQPRPGTEFLLERRRRFVLSGLPAGNVDEISGQVAESAAERTRAGIDGLIDVVQGEPPVELLPTIRSEYESRYEEHPTLALRYLALDTRESPFRDEDVRRALGFALDLAALDRLRDGFLEPTCNTVAPQVVGYRRLDPCPFGERQGNPDLVRAGELIEAAAPRLPRVLVWAGGPHGGASARHLKSTLGKIGLDARIARTPRERARAQVSFARRLPAVPLPGRYLEAVEDPVLESRVNLLQLESDPGEAAEDWAAIDREAVETAQVVPYGVETVGVLLSERMDRENCSRFHPVFGLDWSSLCLR